MSRMVGAPDPEKSASPTFGEDGEHSLELDPEAGVCHFNSVAYPIGQHVLSGTRLLCCEGNGL